MTRKFHFEISRHAGCPLLIYIALLGIALTFNFWKNRIHIEFQTHNTQYDTEVFTTITINFRYPTVYPDGTPGKPHTGIHFESQHWVLRAMTMTHKGNKHADYEVIDQDIIQCSDALIEGTIFGISHRAMFG